MSQYHPGSSSTYPYKDPTPAPSTLPHVQELGTTSAPLKSAAFFIGAHCKEYNGVCSSLSHAHSKTNTRGFLFIELYRGFHAVQGGEQGPCALFEGRQESDAMCDRPVSNHLLASSRISRLRYHSINKMRENCLESFDAHWDCLEYNNHVRIIPFPFHVICTQTNNSYSSTDDHTPAFLDCAL